MSAVLLFLVIGIIFFFQQINGRVVKWIFAILSSLIVLAVFYFLVLDVPGINEARVRVRHHYIQACFESLNNQIVSPASTLNRTTSVDVTSRVKGMVDCSVMHGVHFYLTKTKDRIEIVACESGVQPEDLLNKEPVSYDPSNGTYSEGELIYVLSKEP